MNTPNTSLWQALDRARKLVAQTQRLVQLSRQTVHAARNSRHHASLLRTVVRLGRQRRVTAFPE